MLKKPIKTIEDLSGGLITKGSVLSIKDSQTPDCMNVYTDIYKSLNKRKGYSALNSLTASGAANGIYHYVQSATVQYLVAMFGDALKKMDVVSEAWDGTWDTISKDASGTQLTGDLTHFSTWSANGTLIITTDSQDVPQRINATDTDYIDLDNGGSGTAPSGKYSAVWKSHVWIANISGALDKLQRSANGLYDDWDGTDSGSSDIVTGGDIGLTGIITYKGKLYVFKKWSIHRVTYLSGVPLLDFKEVDSTIGTNSPRTIIKVPTAEGEVVMFLGTDKQIYVFNGYSTIPISEVISTSNGVSSIYTRVITSQMLNRAHAVNYTGRHWATFFVPIAGSTKLLLHCDGADGSTNFPDYTLYHTVTVNGNAQVDTAQKVFGSGSFLSDGTGDFLTIADSSDWHFGAGDFTIDFRIRFNALPGTDWLGGVVSQGTSDRWELLLDNTAGTYSWKFRHKSGGVWVIQISKTTTIAADTWYHVELDRSGNNFYIFQNGTQVGTTETNAAEIDDIAADLSVGTLLEHPAYGINGWIDELRIVKGEAKHTANFTLPTAAYGDIPAYAIVYDYFAKSFWPFDNMSFLSSCVADDGTGQRKVYTQGTDYAYLFDDGNDDDGSDINAYWLSKKLDLGSVPAVKKTYYTEIITNSVDFSLTSQIRKNWESSWSTAESLTDNQEKHVLKTDRIGNLLQYKFADDSSDVAFEILRVDLTTEGVGIGR